MGGMRRLPLITLTTSYYSHNFISLQPFAIRFSFDRRIIRLPLP
ncbi:hypothetical protein QFZ23_003013 [Arthrobacter globiformis]|nr:hypothetical protein [Arthrobacter globiformis]